MKTVLMAEIIKNRQFSDGIYEMVISAPEIAKEAKAGQFLNLYTDRGELLLPRPLSICEIGKTSGNIRILYQTVGAGTDCFSHMQSGEHIKVMGPLGNGFDLSENICGVHVVIGGGIGAPPLLELVKGLQGKVIVYLGFRSKSILVKEFEALGAEVHVTTDDGREGYHGNVMQLIEILQPHTDAIYGCGPKIMLNAVAEWAAKRKIDAQLSMEERMACGIGACVGCAVKIKKNDGDWEYKKVCKDGPVFFGSEVVWNE